MIQTTVSLTMYYIYLIVDNDSLNRENVQVVFLVFDRYDGSPLQ